MAAMFGPKPRGKQHTSVSEAQRARSAKLGQLELNRWKRSIAPKCVCSHGTGVHLSEGCQMKNCECTKFKKRK